MQARFPLYWELEFFKLHFRIFKNKNVYPLTQLRFTFKYILRNHS